jgi:mRNA-degrading endonuclease toxin of MazEF toxin-antitoxin module
MRRGEIWTVVPLSHPKPRPAVIVSVDAWNAHAPDVILVPLTTRAGPSRPPVRHPQLEQTSYAKCGAIAAIPKERLGRRVGAVGEETMRAIARELRRILAT